MHSKALAVLAFAAAVHADQGPWQQCGGINYSGGTVCSSGLYCSKINDYYSQCISGSAVASSAPATSTAASTKPASSAAVTTPPVTRTTLITSSAPTNTAVNSGNPFSGYQQYANPYYSSEVISLAVPSLPASLQAKASAVAKVPTFMWLDVAAKIPLVGEYLANVKALNAAGANPPIIAPFVVYDLPDRDCAALASNGEYAIANGGLANYKAYIDGIRAQIQKYPDVKVVLVIEPDSLANLITNLNVPKCAGAQAAYLEGTQYAIKNLNLPNVNMYLDAGHGGWLGWTANITPAAKMFGDLYKAAGSPAAVRGLATNVANYNAWTIDVCPSYTTPNANCDEKRYVNALAPLLTAQGFPAHFIVDTGRSGKQPTGQIQQGDWCNQIGTGFGLRPGTATGDPLVDSFVWVKPGGEGDGTSDTSSPRYDAHCGYADALKPAPEAGTWFQAYFQQLLVNANPAF